MKTVAIIGRGIAGLTLAYRLAEAGLKVSLWGPDQALPGDASPAAVGVAGVKGLVLARDPLFAAKLTGHRQLREFIPRLEKITGRAIPHSFQGVIEPFSSFAHLQALQERIYHGEFLGCFAVKRKMLAELLKDSYFVREVFAKKGEIKGAFFYRLDGWFDPQALLDALLFAATLRGATIVNQEVRDIVPHWDRGLMLKGARGMPRLYDEVVLACGARTPAILRRLVDLPFKTQTIPGQTLIVEKFFPQEEAFCAERYGLLLRPKGLRFGSLDFTKNHVVTTDDLAAGQNKLRELLNKHFTLQLGEELPSVSLWGERLAVKDRRPFFGALQLSAFNRRLWLCAGFHKNGYSLADLLASSLRDSLLGIPLPAAADEFALRRLIF